MRARLPDDSMVGALLGDPARGDEMVGEVVVRDGMVVRLVPDDVMPPGVPFADGPFDEAWYEDARFEDAVRVRETDGSAGQGPGPGPGALPDPGPDWPPDVVPVFLWPEEVLQQALRGTPGPRLARVVAEAIDLAGNLDPDHGVGAGVLGGLSDGALGDLMVACGRLQSWAAGIQAHVVADRAARETHPLAHNSLVGQVTAELVVTEPEATEVVVRAESGSQHPTVIHALVAGRIDVRKAHILLRSASQLTVAERAEAIRKYLPQAPRRTWKWLQSKMLAFAKDRHGAAQAAQAEAQQRRVHVDRAENDMGWLSAYLPATDAAAVWGVVDDMAHQLKHVAGEDRTLGQLRADCLTGIITGRLLPADRFTTTCTTMGTATATSTGSGTDGPDGADGGQCGDADSVGVAHAADESGAPVCSCGGRAPVVQQVVQEVVEVVRVTPTRPVVRVTIPATALLGLDGAPGDLAGFGPIPADTARLIAQDATWQRLLTDPVTGILTDYSTTTYRPGRVLSTAVQARDATCTFLTCDSPAAWDDLDHIQPFDHDLDPATLPPGSPGQTRAQNLQPLCRKHHLLKTHAGWGIVRDPATGITTWTTPTGRRYTRPPTVLDTHVEIDQIDPDTSYDLTLRALTGQRLPRSYQTTEPGAVPSASDEPADADPSDPPF